MARRVDHLAVDRADLEALAVLEQMIEFRAVARDVHRVEHGPEDPLHVLDVLADRDRGAGFQFDVRRARQMIGMHMRLQHLCRS